MNSNDYLSNDGITTHFGVGALEARPQKQQALIGLVFLARADRIGSAALLRRHFWLGDLVGNISGRHFARLQTSMM